MASQVLSGPSNPSYTNNTGQNVRIVINYMEGTPFVAAQFQTVQNFNLTTRQVQTAAAVPSRITLTWAGVSVGSSWDQGNISIGRNLAYSQLFRDTQAGGTQTVEVGLARDAQGIPLGLTDANRPVRLFEAVAVNTSVALAAVANNANGQVSGIPTELILAPGETFSAICGVHNIVAIPENG